MLGIRMLLGGLGVSQEPWRSINQISGTGHALSCPVFADQDLKFSAF